jgi:uncharacterized protein (TIGR03086 family)
MDDREALSRAVDVTDQIVRHIKPDQMANETPCPEWDVRSLINHLIGQLGSLEGKLTGSDSERSAPPGALPSRDLAGDDPSAAFSDVARATESAAAEDGALERAGMALGAITADVVVHGWDLARATGQDAAFDDQVSDHLLRFVRQGITDQNRSPMFGPEVQVPADAPATERLVAFLGRRP